MDDLNTKLEIVIQACEKAVKLAQSHESRINELESHIQDLTTRLESSEAQLAATQGEIAELSTSSGISSWNSSAPDDLYNYMMSVKDDTGAEIPMSKKEIAQKMEQQAKVRYERMMNQNAPMRPNTATRVLRGTKDESE